MWIYIYIYSFTPILIYISYIRRYIYLWKVWRMSETLVWGILWRRCNDIAFFFKMIFSSQMYSDKIVIFFFCNFMVSWTSSRLLALSLDESCWRSYKSMVKRTCILHWYWYLISVLSPLNHSWHLMAYAVNNQHVFKSEILPKWMAKIFYSQFPMFARDPHDHQLWNAARWREPAFDKEWSTFDRRVKRSSNEPKEISTRWWSNMYRCETASCHKKSVDGQVLVQGMCHSEYQ